MNRWQKIAWFNLTVIAVGLIISTTVIALMATKVGMPRALRGLCFMGICGFMCLSPIIFRKKPAHIDFDERDSLFGIRASWAGFGASYLFFIVWCIVTWFIVGFDGTVPFDTLPYMVVGGYITFELVRSVAVLVQYGRGKGEKL